MEPTGEPWSGLARVRELSERGLSRAAESLGRMLGSSIRLTLREIRHVPSRDLPALVEHGDSSPVIGLTIRIQGQGGGWIFVVFPVHAIYGLLRALMRTPMEPHDLTGLELSAVQEVGNVLASSFLSELGDRLGRRLMPSAPEIHLTNLSRIVRDMLASPHALDTELLVVQARLEDVERNIEGRFFAVPEVRALEPITGAAGG